MANPCVGPHLGRYSRRYAPLTLIPMATTRGEHYYNPYFADKETEAQGVKHGCCPMAQKGQRWD